LDDLLRGRRTTPELLAGGKIDIPLRTFVLLAVILGAIYGFFMGWFGLFNPDARFHGVPQLLATIAKIPALFLFTLVVTFPSLYVFNALVGGRLDFGMTLKLLVAAIVINLAVAASLGPILGFFTVSTTSYPFMVLLNVLLLAIAGTVGLGFLLQTLKRIMAPWRPPLPQARPPASPGEESSSSAKPASVEVPSVYVEEDPRVARSIFRVWIVIYALVGAQMGWILRPFIGAPNMPFELFRHRHGNFFMAVMQQLGALFNSR
jgi:hypothetical protein